MVVRIIKPVLTPVLVAQAALLRRVAIELPEPAGERHGVVHCPGAEPCPRPFSLLVAGDSSAAGVGAETQDDALAPRLAAALAERMGASVQWHLFARTGLTSVGVLELLKAQALPAADVAVVVLGVNDITRNVPIGKTMRARSRIVRMLKARTGVGHILFPGLPAVERFPVLPQPLAWYGGAEARRSNALQARWAAHPSRSALVTHVPMDGFTHPQLMAEDGYHPSPILYAMVAKHLAEQLSVKIGAENEQR